MNTKFSKLYLVFLPVVITVVLYSIFFVGMYKKYDYDLNHFIFLGEYFVSDKNELPQNVTYLPNSYGYDGQFYYRLSFDPFTDKKDDFGIFIDYAPYRQQRIMLSLIVFLLSFIYSNHAFLFVAVNFAALTVISVYASLYAASINKNPLYGLILSLYAGFLFTFSRNLTEIVAIMFLFAGMYHLQEKKYYLSGLLLSLAVLSRETVILFPAAILISMIFDFFAKKRMDKRALFAAICPIIVFVCWKLWLINNWSELPSEEFSNFNVIPFLGFFLRIVDLSDIAKNFAFDYIIEFSVLFFLAFFSCKFFLKSKAENYIKISFLLYFAMVAFLSIKVWFDDYAFMRVLSEFVFFCNIILLNVENKIVNIAMGFSILLWFYLFVDLILVISR